MSKNFPPPPPERRPGAGAAPSDPKPEAKSKEAEAKPKPKPKLKTPTDWPWRPTVRVVVSALVAIHLTAVFSAPWYIQLRPIEGSNPAIEPGSVVRDATGRPIPLEELRPDEFPPQRPYVPRGLFEFFVHYNNLLYTNNGYDFFSPNPAPSQLIRYWLYDSGGQEIGSGMFPDREKQWPRLFYHRHMMLAAQVAELGEAGLRSYARHLLRTHPAASRVHLELGIHHLLTPKVVLEGKPLDASDTYETIESIDEVAGPRTAAPSSDNGGQP
jgi:hypothetical protein